MSKRLQVLLSDAERAEIRRLVRRERLTVGEWVRRALHDARSRQHVNNPETRLRAIRQAARYSFPTGDIDQMLKEIEQGYQS